MKTLYFIPLKLVLIESKKIYLNPKRYLYGQIVTALLLPLQQGVWCNKRFFNKTRQIDDFQKGNPFQSK